MWHDITYFAVMTMLAVLSVFAGFKYRLFEVYHTEDPIVPEPVLDPPVTIIPSPPPMPTNQEKLYQTAKFCLGKHMIITPHVPNLLGCASSVSGVLQTAGYHGLPVQGIAGTATLYDFLRESVDFEETDSFDRGIIIISQSGVAGAVLEHGHVGIMGDSGILSNDSDTGLWREEWTLSKWIAYYHDYGKLPVHGFRWLG